MSGMGTTLWSMNINTDEMGNWQRANPSKLVTRRKIKDPLSHHPAAYIYDSIDCFKWCFAHHDKSGFSGTDAVWVVAGDTLCGATCSPIYHADENLLKALESTKSPEDMLIKDIRWPMSAMFFVLPIGYLKEETTNKDVVFVGIGLRRDCLTQDQHGQQTPRQDVCSVLLMDENHMMTSWASLTDRNLGSIMQSTADAAVSMGCERLEELKSTMKNAVSLAFGLLLASAARPELLSRGGVFERGKMRKGKLTPSVWNPNFIGRGYRVKRSSSSSDNHLKGTHASPQFHWRKGHWRNQPCGPLRAERILLWIEPMAVGGHEE
jgi:hypothetical protein